MSTVLTYQEWIDFKSTMEPTQILHGYISVTDYTTVSSVAPMITGFMQGPATWTPDEKVLMAMTKLVTSYQEVIDFFAEETKTQDAYLLDIRYHAPIPVSKYYDSGEFKPVTTFTLGGEPLWSIRYALVKKI